MSCHLPNRFQKRSKSYGKFKSKLEQEVNMMLPKDSKYEFETLLYVLPKRYTPDFNILAKSGKTIYLEVKGYFRFEDQQKMKAVKYNHPNLDIRMYFPRDNKVQNSGMLNSEWCEKYSFPYAIGKFPRGWFN